MSNGAPRPAHRADWFVHATEDGRRPSYRLLMRIGRTHRSSRRPRRVDSRPSVAPVPGLIDVSGRGRVTGGAIQAILGGVRALCAGFVGSFEGFRVAGEAVGLERRSLGTGSLTETRGNFP